MDFVDQDIDNIYREFASSPSFSIETPFTAYNVASTAQYAYPESLITAEMPYAAAVAPPFSYQLAAAPVFVAPPSKIYFIKHPKRNKDIDEEHAARVVQAYNSNSSMPSAIPKNKNKMDADEMMLGIKLVNMLRDNGYDALATERFAVLFPNRVCLRCIPQGKHGDVVKGQMYCSPCSKAIENQAVTLEEDIAKWVMLDNDSKCYNIKTMS
jgi:hypothetical protein